MTLDMVKAYTKAHNEIKGHPISTTDVADLLVKRYVEIDRLKTALKWYKDEATAAALFIRDDKPNPEVGFNILLVLSNDNGRRARAAMGDG